MRLQTQHTGGCSNLVLQTKSQPISGALHLCSTDSTGSHSNKSHCLLGSCLSVSCFWHGIILNVSEHPNYIFLPANGTGMLLFNIQRSQVAVASPVIPDQLSWPPLLATGPWDGIPPGEAESEYSMYSETPFTHLHNGPHNSILLPRGSSSKCGGTAPATGNVSLEVQLPWGKKH